MIEWKRVYFTHFTLLLCAPFVLWGWGGCFGIKMIERERVYFTLYFFAYFFAPDEMGKQENVFSENNSIQTSVNT